MKILLVYPNIGFVNQYAFQCGLAYISAVLKKAGHGTNLAAITKNKDMPLLLNQIEQYHPDLIAFSAVSTQFVYIEKIAERIKQKTKCIIIVGGVHVTIIPEELEKSQYIDGIIRGEGEYPLLELADALEKNKDCTRIPNLWIKKDNKIYKNKLRPLIKNLDKLPFPDRELFGYQKIIDKQDGQATFIFSRGCLYNCSYCCNHVLTKIYKGNYFRTRSAEKAIEEIKLVLANYKIKKLFFDDDIFSMNKKWAEKFLEKYKRDIKQPFGCNLRPGSADKKLLGLFKEAGCDSFSIGIESGNEEIRKKVLNRHMSNESIIHFFKLIKEIGIRTRTYNLIGLPYETSEKFKDTIKLNVVLQPDEVILGIFHPYPGTRLLDMCRRNNLVTAHKLQYIERSDTILNLPNFSRKQILTSYKRFGYQVYKNSSIKKAWYYKLQANKIAYNLYTLSKGILGDRPKGALLK